MTPTPLIWKAPGLGWHMRVSELRPGQLTPSLWGLSYGGGATSPWWRPTRRMAERKARRVIRSIVRERQAHAAEKAALDALHPPCRCHRSPA